MKLKKAAERILSRTVPAPFKEIVRIYGSTRPVAKRTCPCCDYSGFFGLYGSPPRVDARCPKCGSLERHRLFYLAYRNQMITIGETLQEPILHFAAEPIIERTLRTDFQSYQTADLFEVADLQLNLEDIQLTDESIGTVIANHVLEHVDDGKALNEIHRILKPDGVFITSVPIVEGWSTTYENAEIKSDEERVLHFGQNDHVRYYGRDFRERVESAGFSLESEITSEGSDVVKYSLTRGEKLFVFRK